MGCNQSKAVTIVSPRLATPALIPIPAPTPSNIAASTVDAPLESSSTIQPPVSITDSEECDRAASFLESVESGVNHTLSNSNVTRLPDSFSFSFIEVGSETHSQKSVSTEIAHSEQAEEATVRAEVIYEERDSDCSSVQMMFDVSEFVDQMLQEIVEKISANLDTEVVLEVHKNDKHTEEEISDDPHEYESNVETPIPTNTDNVVADETTTESLNVQNAKNSEKVLVDETVVALSQSKVNEVNDVEQNPVGSENGDAAVVHSVVSDAVAEPMTQSTIVHAQKEIEAEPDIKASEPSIPLSYHILETTTENGIVMYHIQQCGGRNGKWPIPVTKRYTEFVYLHSKLLASRLPHSSTLPSIPQAGFLSYIRGRQHKRTIQQRQKQFDNLLRYISSHHELANSAIFQSFLNV